MNKEFGNKDFGKITYALFQESVPTGFHNNLSAELRPLLGRLPQSFLAIGAYLDGEPAGIALARYDHPPDAGAHLLGIGVAVERRRSGIGRGLIAELSALLRRSGFSTLNTEYLSGLRPDAAESLFLQACGFQTPAPGIYICGCRLEYSVHAPWVTTLKLPEPFSCSPFNSLTSEESEEIRQGLGLWYPPILDPFAEEELIDRERSVILRHQGRLAGWMILEPFDARTILYKTMFVRKEYQRMARGVALMAEISRRMMQDPVYEEFVFFVEADNRPMAKFLEKHIVSEQLRKEVLWRTRKAL
ncbi:GNAT family N-acetyltransferase [Paenibacillus pinistramenti]|uniref:GNAT family N-acetyltransferase n=1 Tax=Paenibacillus pinistramenti TaxID=1768003 RepID=UPI001107C8A6|nr:GNAT family N-acetyltransferase [Paenibacillus pinistramenti]